MLHVGILAHSTEGAALCFRTFCQEGFAALGPHDHPDVTMDCIALARSMPHWDSGDHEPIREVLSQSVDRLAAAGADFFICPDNTAHMAIQLPGAPFALPGLHIAQVVADQAAREGRTQLGVLATSYTMESSLYPDALAALGIRAIVPGADDRAIINRVIFDELLAADIRPESQQEFVRIIADLAERGCDAVALVCTEIPLLITPDISPLPTLDSTRLLARAALDVCMGQRPMPTWPAHVTS